MSTNVRAAASVLLLDDRQSVLFHQWRNKALEIMPYAAPLLFRFRALNAPGLGTMACDKGMRLYLDMGYIEGRGLSWAADGLLHECMHIYGMHFDRASVLGLDTAAQLRLWNIAGDMANNDDLVPIGCSTLGTGEDPMPKMIGMDDHLNAETYYAVLRKKSQGQAAKKPASGTGDSGDGIPKFSGCGSVSGGEAAPCELGADGGQVGQKGAALSADEITEAITQMANQATEHSKSRGNVPTGIIEMAATITAPPAANWKRTLLSGVSRVVRRAGSGSSDWSRINRRKHHIRVGGRRVIYPSTVTRKPFIVVIRDTSGSMGDTELSRASAEVVNISARAGVRGKHLLVIDVDARAYEPIPFRDAKQLRTVRGRGGTDMRMGLDKVAEMKEAPSAVIVLSDLDTPWPAHRTPWPLFIVGVGTTSEIRSKAKSVPSWATCVHADTALKGEAA